MDQHNTVSLVVTRKNGREAEDDLPITAEAAASAADFFLANEVGDLLMVEGARLVRDGRRRWVFSVVLGNAVRGLLGRVGSIAVDADTGEVLFESGERERIEANAERLHRAAPP